MIMMRRTLWSSLLAVITAIITALPLVNAGTFTDDNGVAHTWDAEQPTIVTGSMDAVAFFHFGMDASQIKATFSERSASGSNYGGIYADGNLADHGDHANAAYEPSLFPADPDDAERAFLAPLADLSPTCSASNYFCGEVSIALLNEMGWPDVVVWGSKYGSILTDEFRGNATEKGVPLIELNNAYTSTPETPVTPLGMVEMIERVEELTIALGVDAAKVESMAGPDKTALCRAASEFTKAAEGAQSRGVRAMAGYLPYTQAGENGEVGAFLASPERDPVLAMFEELGMAILHNDAAPTEYYEYAVTPDFSVGLLDAESPMSAGVVGDPVPYHIDFWLYDDRVTLDFLSDSFAKAWPHKAVVEKQYAYFPPNAKVLSYRHAAEILSVVGPQLDKAKKLFDAETTCTPSSGEGGYGGDAHRNGGLLPGQYACFEPAQFDFCPDEGSGSDASRSVVAKMITLLTVLVVGFLAK